MAAARTKLDPITQATVTVAWVIFANKPFYPVYVWWLVGSGVTASLATLISAPFFLAIPFVARRWPLAARVMLPLVGTVDTLFETALFGTGSGTELFYAPCVMLAALAFMPHEKWWQRGTAVLVFLIFMISRTYLGAPMYPWNPTELSILLNLNAFAVASLMTFIALRYAGLRSGNDDVSPARDERPPL
jgi:hypothetical protein